ncbi:MAG: response regulator, partial [Candidatus Komeilibacteria bacterium]|nr:response regulator [Candidatus Komeilibacteria bacterium]
KMDGFSVLKALKEDDTTKDIPVILLTNLGQDEDIQRGKDLGAVGYLVKANLTPSEVVEEVKAKLGKK